jgi:signal transduction histidine kinase
VTYPDAVSAERELQERRFVGRWSTITLIVLVAGAIAMSLPRVQGWSAVATVALALAFLAATTRGAAHVERMPAPRRWRALAGLFTLQLTLAAALALASHGMGILVFFATASQGALYAPPRWAAVVIALASGLCALSFWWHTPQYALQQLVSLGTSMAFVVAFSSAVAGREDLRRQSADLAAELAAANVRLSTSAEASEHLAAERERNRIAREIHDTAGHHLTAAHVQILAARALLESDPARAGLALDHASGLTRKALEEVRRAVVVMRSEAESPPLPDRLARLVADVSMTSLCGELSILGAPRALPMGVEIALFRAAQEAITNVYRHAGASRVQLTLTYAVDNVRLHVLDDGFDEDRERPAPGVGLALMAERLREIGGGLAVERTSSGFGLTMEVPT